VFLHFSSSGFVFRLKAEKKLNRTSPQNEPRRGTGSTLANHGDTQPGPQGAPDPRGGYSKMMKFHFPSPAGVHKEPWVSSSDPALEQRLGSGRCRQVGSPPVCFTPSPLRREACPTSGGCWYRTYRLNELVTFPSTDHHLADKVVIANSPEEPANCYRLKFNPELHV